MTHDMSEAIANNREPENNWREYFSFSTDHKVIGVQYMVMTFIFSLLGS